MSLNSSYRTDFNMLPPVAGVAIASLGILVSMIGTVTMIFSWLHIGFLIVLSGWSLIILGNMMDNTGFLIDSQYSDSS